MKVEVVNCHSRQKLEFKLSESYIDEQAEGLILNEKKEEKRSENKNCFRESNSGEKGKDGYPE